MSHGARNLLPPNNLFQSKKMKKAQIVTVQSINQGLIRLYTNLRVNFWRRLVL
jgi:hypothetical protein